MPQPAGTLNFDHFTPNVHKCSQNTTFTRNQSFSSSEQFIVVPRRKQHHLYALNSGADPGGVQGVRTPALLIRVPFVKRTVSITNITGNA